MSTVALIPARGGSKRLPRKNILGFNATPMLAYPIDAARKTGLFEEIYVSTEDEEIAQIARKYGAAVISRPQALAEDDSTQLPKYASMHWNACQPFLLFAAFTPLSVLLQPETIIAGYKLLEREPLADFVMGVSEYSQPPVQALKTDDQGYLSYMWPEWSSVQLFSHNPN